MNLRILADDKYTWHYEKSGNAGIWFKGLIWHGGKYYQGIQACRQLARIFGVNKINKSNLFTVGGVKNEIQKLNGHFSFIINEHDNLVSAVDKIRSYPIFYSNKGNTIYFSNSALKLQDDAGLYEKDKDSFLEFEMAGYVTGRNTLFKDLFQIQAGEFILFNKKSSNLEVVRYYRYWPDEIMEKTEEALIDELHKVTVKTFSGMVETLEGRPVWIPLSGGLDSRLVLAMLHQLKYDNISTFSYGMPGLWEIEHAKRIAEYLNIKWHYVPYKPNNTKALFHTTERKEYFDFASGLSSVPFLSDFYAVWNLKDSGTIPDNAIIINGQTGDYLTGGHIPQKIENLNADDVDVNLLLKEIIAKHFSLWTNLKTEENISNISEKILSLVQLTSCSKISISEFVQYFELHEWQERQSKYVVNGQRMYEWFGYDWRLPLWSDELMDFWLNVNWKEKIGQRLYKKYLIRNNCADIFKIESPLQYPYTPFFVKVLNMVFGLLGRIAVKDADLYSRKFSKYFMTYAPFYPQKNYFEFLKDSKWHRNVISYYARDILRNI